MDLIEKIIENWGWPIVAVIFILKFGNNISEILKSIPKLLSRTTKIGKEGIEMETNLSEQQSLDKIKALEAFDKGIEGNLAQDTSQIPSTPDQEKTDGSSQFNKLMSNFDLKDKSFYEKEKITTDQIKGFNLKTEEENKVLIRAFALTEMYYSFEKTYSIIGGGQISILSHLNTVPSIGEKPTILKIFYDEAVEKKPIAFVDYSFDNYIDYLEESLFVKKENDLYFITEWGASFLRFIVDTKKSFNRLY